MGRERGREGLREGGREVRKAIEKIEGIPCGRGRKKKREGGREGGRAGKESDEKGPKSRHSVWEGSKKVKKTSSENAGWGGREGGRE